MTDPLLEEGGSVRPILDSAALHGPAGDFVAEAAPYTEADRAGVLVATLTLLGGAIGPTPHLYAGNRRHSVNLFCVLVGESAKGRKGTAAAIPEELVARIDSHFATERMLGGFGSGEALIDAVRDGEENAPTDKRLAVVEAEFGRMLKVAGRDGSTLSQNIRQAWDSVRMETRSRARTVVANKHHISAVCQITADELRARLTDTETYGGTANRFLFALTRQSRLLPEGGNVPEDVMDHHAGILAKLVHEARQHTAPMSRSESGREAWADLYERLAADEPSGLLAAVIGRDSAQCLRLSMLYALLDGSREIDAVHVAAAEALWMYARQTADYIFGDKSGDPLADRLYDAVREAGPDGLDRTGQDAALGKNFPAARIDSAADRLVERGLVERVEDRSGPGRPRKLLVTTEKTD